MSGKNEPPRGGSEDKECAPAEKRSRVKDPAEISMASDEIITQVEAGLMEPATANTILKALSLQRSCAADALARPGALGDRGDAAGIDYMRTHPQALKALASSLDPTAFQRIVRVLRDDGKDD